GIFIAGIAPGGHIATRSAPQTDIPSTRALPTPRCPTDTPKPSSSRPWSAASTATRGANGYTRCGTPATEGEAAMADAAGLLLPPGPRWSIGLQYSHTPLLQRVSHASLHPQPAAARHSDSVRCVVPHLLPGLSRAGQPD